MKRVTAIFLASLLLFGVYTTTFAVDSPTATTTTTTENKSPKTGDNGILFIEAAGVLLAVTAVVSCRRFAKTN